MVRRVSPNNPIANIERGAPRLLHYFLAVAEELNFSRAAERLNMSQPPLSMHIKELEQLLETPLFRRSTRSVELTRAGQALHGEVQRIQQTTMQSLRFVHQMGRGLAGHIKIGIVGTAVWGRLLPALQKHTTAFPDISWSIEEMTAAEQIEALTSHRIDIGVWRQTDDYALAPALCRRLLERERLMVALPDGHHLLAGEGDIELQALRDEAFIGLSQNEHSLGRQITNLLQDNGIEPRLNHIVSEPQTALALVAEGYGITLLPENYSSISWPLVQFRFLAKWPNSSLYLVSHRRDATETVQKFLQDHF